MPDNVNNFTVKSLALTHWNIFKFVDKLRASTHEKAVL